VAREYSLNLTLEFRNLGFGLEGGMGPVNKFFNTGQICTKQVTSLESWILSEGRPAISWEFPFRWVPVFKVLFFLFDFSLSLL
jgi:hypothetical protein